MNKPKMKLRDVLALLDSSNPLPDEWKAKWDDIRPESSYKVTLCFMCEEETWVTTYPGHPLLIPWYDCLVTSIDPNDDDTLNVWLDYEPYWQNMIGWKGDNE